MIIGLRRRHRWMLPILGLASATVFILAWTNRKPYPITEADTILKIDLSDQTPESQITTRWLNQQVDVSIYQMNANRTISIRSEEPFEMPSLLIYASSTVSTDGLPADARLLGGFIGGHLNYYELSSDSEKIITLYSLGHQRLVGTVSLQDEGSAP